MRTPEGTVKDKVKAVLKKHGAWWHMAVVNGMGEPTLDFTVCLNGWAIFIEAKAPGKKPTPRQRVTIAEMEAAGAQVFVVSNPDEVAMLDAALHFFQNKSTDEVAAHRALHTP